MGPEMTDNIECGCEIQAEDWDLIICRCEEVTRGDILQAINEGARTVEEVKRRTRAGMGLCQAKTCYRVVRAILSEVTGQPQAEILPFTTRPPLRPISIAQLAALDDEGKE
jgi:NAD(P)H-nitrite reductase large subunit